MGKYRKYTPEFKVQAVELAVESGNVSKTARDLDIGETTLFKWVKAYEAENVRTGLSLNPPDAMKVKELEKENLRLKRENEFLKKAAAFFAKSLA